MANSFFKKFSIQRFFNPANGLSEHADTVAPVPEKVDLAEVAQSMENPDGSINHGSQGAELGKTLDVQKEVQDQVMKTVQEAINNPNTTPEMREGYQAAVERHDEGMKQVGVSTMEAIVKEGLYDKKEKYSVQWEGDQVSDESMMHLITDLDWSGAVQRGNRGRLRRLLTGNDNSQKFIIGEQQLKNAMFAMTMNDIDNLYRRITGATDSLRLTAKDMKKVEINTKNTTREEKKLDTSKIKAFQEALLQEVEIVNSIGKILMNNDKYSAGLMTVLEGKQAEDIKVAFNDPEKVKKFQGIISSSPELVADKNVLNTIAKVLMNIGVTGAFSIMSAGTIGVKMQSEQIKTHQATMSEDVQWGQDKELSKNYLKTSAENLSAKYILGPNGKSVALDFDLVGLTGEVNWNDQSARIDVAQRHFNAVPDKRQAYQQVVQLIEARLPSQRNGDVLSGEDSAKVDAVHKLTQHYVRLQETVLASMNAENKQVAIQQMMENTKNYAAAVEQVNGLQLKGAYAQIGLQWFAVGLAATKTELSATTEGIAKDSAKVEAMMNGPEVLTDEKLNLLLGRLGIHKDVNGQYVIKGQPLVVPEGKQVQWQVENLYYMDRYSYSANYSFVDIGRQIEHKMIKINLNNQEYRNAYLEANSKTVADFMLQQRRSSKEIVNIQYQIEQGNYNDASELLSKYLNSVQGKGKNVANDLNEALSIAKNNDKELKHFLDLVLEKMSGGTGSRQLADKLMAGADITKELTNYYENVVGQAFAEGYGIKKEQVLALANQLILRIDSSSRRTLWSVSQDFNALVAYSQVMSNGNTGFKALDHINHTNAQIAWEPVEVIDVEVANNIRQQMNAKFTEADIQQVRIDNPDIAHLSDVEIRKNLFGGPVKAYMSFVPDAECFNLGFMIEPLEYKEQKESLVNKAQNVLYNGTVVGKKEATNNLYGVHLGWNKKEWKNEEKPKEETVETKDSTTMASDVSVVSNPEDAAKALQQTANQTVEATANLSGEAAKVVDASALVNVGWASEAITNVTTDAVKTATEVATQAAETVATATTQSATEVATSTLGKVWRGLRAAKQAAQAAASGGQ